MSSIVQYKLYTDKSLTIIKLYTAFTEIIEMG